MNNLGRTFSNLGRFYNHFLKEKLAFSFLITLFFSIKNTRESLWEIKKHRNTTFASGLFPTSFLVFVSFHSCLFYSKKARRMFSVPLLLHHTWAQQLENLSGSKIPVFSITAGVMGSRVSGADGVGCLVPINYQRQISSYDIEAYSNTRKCMKNSRKISIALHWGPRGWKLKFRKFFWWIFQEKQRQASFSSIS